MFPETTSGVYEVEHVFLVSVCIRTAITGLTTACNWQLGMIETLLTYYDITPDAITVALAGLLMDSHWRRYITGN